MRVKFHFPALSRLSFFRWLVAQHLWRCKPERKIFSRESERAAGTQEGGSLEGGAKVSPRPAAYSDLCPPSTHLILLFIFLGGRCVLVALDWQSSLFFLLRKTAPSTERKVVLQVDRYSLTIEQKKNNNTTFFFV